MDFDRVLATVLFTDVVASTEVAARMGDRAWRDLIATHHQRVRSLLGRFRGREVDVADDGFFAVFDGPARAVRCGLTICDDAGALGFDVRVGVHTGEVELDGAAVRGQLPRVHVWLGFLVRTSLANGPPQPQEEPPFPRYSAARAEAPV